MVLFSPLLITLTLLSCEEDTSPSAGGDTAPDTALAEPGETGAQGDTGDDAPDGASFDVDPGDVYPESGCWSASTGYLFGAPPTGALTSAVDGPVPTHDWWTSLIWDCMDWGDAYSTDLHAQPLIFKADAGGLNLHYADRPTTATATDTRFGAASGYDLHVGVDGLDADAATMRDSSDWIVTAGWEDGALDLAATIGRGLPFAYFEADGSAVSIAIGKAWSVVEEGDGWLAIQVDGERTYGIYALPGTAVEATDAGVRADSAYVAVGALPDASAETLERFLTHAYARPIETRVAWSYDEPSATLTTRFEVETEAAISGADPTPLLALYPHQRRATEAPLLDLWYESARGPMQLLAADQFETRYTFHGLLPGLPLMPETDGALLASLLADEDPSAVNTTSDTYYGGKGLAKLGALLHLAQLLGDEDAASGAAGAMTEALEDWFYGADDATPLFAYHEDWTTLIGYPAAYGSDTELNDHHFHWGYFLHAAAAIALLDPTWARDDQWGGMVKMLVRDAANPLRDDPEFPFLRSFDPYAGHSWANGHAGFPDGNNQESSSESIFFASGLIRFGEATGNDTLRDLGIYLYVTEVAAIQDYWFDVHGETWTENYDHETAGIVWGSGVAYATWFSGDPEMKLGIQYLPIHAGSLHLGLYPDALGAQYDEVLAENGGAPDVWSGILWSGLAAGDGARAWELLEPELETYGVEGGETRAATYHWVRGLAELGRLDPDVTADAVGYAVFEGAQGTSHVAFNSDCADRTVTFSDGVQIEVAPRTMAAVRGDEALGEWTLGSCEERAPESCDDVGPNARYYLIEGGLDAAPPTEASELTVPANTGYNVNVRPDDAALLLTFTAEGISGAYSGEAPVLNVVLDTDAVAQAIQAQLSADLDADGAVDRQEMYTYWATDAAAGSWESFSNNAIASESGAWGDLTGATVTLEIWSSFGGEEVQLRVGDSWLELPLAP